MPCTYCHDPNCNESPPKTLARRRIADVERDRDEADRELTRTHADLDAVRAELRQVTAERDSLHQTMLDVCAERDMVRLRILALEREMEALEGNVYEDERDEARRERDAARAEMDASARRIAALERDQAGHIEQYAECLGQRDEARAEAEELRRKVEEMRPMQRRAETAEYEREDLQRECEGQRAKLREAEQRALAAEGRVAPIVEVRRVPDGSARLMVNGNGCATWPWEGPEGDADGYAAEVARCLRYALSRPPQSGREDWPLIDATPPAATPGKAEECARCYGNGFVCGQPGHGCALPNCPNGRRPCPACAPPAPEAKPATCTCGGMKLCAFCRGHETESEKAAHEPDRRAPAGEGSHPVHPLKTWPGPFDAVRKGVKRFLYAAGMTKHGKKLLATIRRRTKEPTDG